MAGTSDNSVYVYDIDCQQTILRIPGHSQHVNAVCFGDASSPHILYSGSDDTLIKVWDRRSMSDSRAAGVFMGHTEGLTYVDSKGDGRYVLSNGKDQTMKLWDLRKMISNEKAATIDHNQYTTQFDYRFMTYSEADYRPHPHDCSIVTYRGHSVLKTLIRCHFSPPSSTNSRYVYSGSEDGSVYIYNLDATLAGRINVREATRHLQAEDLCTQGGAFAMRNSRRWSTCVRDASWHPHAPMIAGESIHILKNPPGPSISRIVSFAGHPTFFFPFNLGRPALKSIFHSSPPHLVNCPSRNFHALYNTPLPLSSKSIC